MMHAKKVMGMSAEDPSSETLERIHAIYRIVLGATVGFLPFVMFFLVRDAKIDLLPAAIFWFLTFWIIVGEIWSVEDTTSYYTSNNKYRNFIYMVYLIFLTMLPVVLILGLDPSNILKSYVSYIVGEQNYHNVQPYIFTFVIISIIDIVLQGSYLVEEKYRSDSTFFVINIIFDIFFIFVYIVLIYNISGKSIIYSAIVLTIAYSVEFSLQWIVAPLLMPQTYGDENDDEDSTSNGSGS